MAHDTLDPAVPPRLPSAQEQYDARFMDQYSNVLRLYFNRLSNLTSSLISPTGGQYVDFPNGLFFNTASQTPAAINTGYPIVFNNTYLHNRVDLQSGSTSRVEVGVNGIYNFQYSGALKSTNSSSKTVWIWLVRSGTTIGYSTKAYTIHLNAQYLPIAWNFNIDMLAGQYLEIYWATSDVNVALTAEVAATPHPGIPSSVLTVNYMAPLPDPLPTPP